MQNKVRRHSPLPLQHLGGNCQDVERPGCGSTHQPRCHSAHSKCRGGGGSTTPAGHQTPGKGSAPCEVDDPEANQGLNAPLKSAAGVNGGAGKGQVACGEGTHASGRRPLGWALPATRGLRTLLVRPPVVSPPPPPPSERQSSAAASLAVTAPPALWLRRVELWGGRERPPPPAPRSQTRHGSATAPMAADGTRTPEELTAAAAGSEAEAGKEGACAARRLFRAVWPRLPGGPPRCLGWPRQCLRSSGGARTHVRA